VSENDAAPGESVTATPKVITTEVSVTDSTVTLDQLSIVINRIDKLVKETRRGIVVAIVATFLTAFAIGLETWIGPVGVIVAIVLIGVFVVVILRHIFNGGLLERSQTARRKS
jgi:hypothetical protein